MDIRCRTTIETGVPSWAMPTRTDSTFASEPGTRTSPGSEVSCWAPVSGGGGGPPRFGESSAIGAAAAVCATAARQQAQTAAAASFTTPALLGPDRERDARPVLAPLQQLDLP